MDDPDMESEIQDYSSSDGSDKMNWILDKGLMLGKKALLTGIVISSVPFVLPPLVVFSALGLAFSVPSGLAVATYACTEKIMSKLLPMPNPPPLALEYVEEISSDEKEDDMGFGGEIDMGKEEDKLMEDTKRGVEVRIEFVDKGKEEQIEGKVLVEQDDLGPESILNDEVAEPVIQLGGDQLVEESSYEEDVGDGIPKEGEQPLENIDVGVEESRDGKVHRLVIVFEKNDSNVEEIRDEHPETEIPRVVVKVEKMDESVEEGETLIQAATMADIIDENKLAGETTGLLERIRDEGKSVEEAEQQGKGISGGNLDEMSVDNVAEAEKQMNDGVETIDVRSIKDEEQRHIVYKKTMVVIGGMDVDNSVTEDLRKENVISSNADVREIADESGFDLFDDKNEAVEQYPRRVCGVRIGFRGENGRDFIPESKVLSEIDSTVKSNEEQVPESEEKIWERIDAMRAIVGYKAPSSRTCVEELKALYMFTGVEPPPSFKDPSDLMEVSSRLQFLMSIVGVK
ncbi:hypothetical protein VitviT2T_005355 [Vitis vinifera]|uniref:Uncharacterized protein n=2 Tax=Vitis vinifera TaxID=29760 RepID=A0ABY9BTD4_VITVI|nr:uncharacterized protein LOC100251233 isoform X3 [Vitis vinifera]XP_059592344.1 uncharacterized protein LOC100251233 isoform X3 [Vitis vinifera]XP_059592345.1 uncharacterized protein LOC100251233 isoform X3 [Vitis vinifera]XP_059592346.1 uncharacterized protein LOC100251233 isoform X3 [Vitis vinifera]WJZ85838.1 hypothetical protein VitviT2T_005355 [Vitis vinifera]|eukprot:XP_010649269.1 PREDICTED: uncharacterized protein LOC100251233 isoform X3 [Vitis vinifera]